VMETEVVAAGPTALLHKGPGEIFPGSVGCQIAVVGQEEEGVRRC
jgi:hypothetical protein